MPLNDLEALVFVEETGTITGAARQLGVPKSTVSRRLSRLEDELGSALITRTGRRVALTAVAKELVRRSGPALNEIRDALRGVGDLEEEPSGTLKITTLPDFGATAGMTHALLQFGERYPRVTVELFLTPRVVDIAHEGFDIALRPVGPTSTMDSTLMARRLVDFTAGFYTTPEYLESCGGEIPFDELPNHVLAIHDRASLVLSLSSIPISAFNARFRVNDFNQLTSVVLAGGGVGILPMFHITPLVRSGQLVQLFEPFSTPGGMALVWPEARYLAPRVRAFIDFMADYVRSTCAFEAPA